jgi:glyoxylase-like metal-dependent hydrolase (beta-lactamase superfamily II)
VTPIRIDAANPSPMTGRGNVTWLLDGAAPAIVDAGVGAPAHVEAIARALGGRPLAHVLVTHGHRDHLAGVPALRARWPALAAWKCPSPDRDEGPDWHPLADGQRVAAGDGLLTVVHTPGHAPDHVCFWHAPTRALFGGDMVLRGTTVMIPAGRGGSLRAYLASLARLAALAPACIYPGHGDIIDRPEELIAEYQAHRQLRERQVLACLDKGLTTPDEMVPMIYPELPPALLPAARETLLAHLQKIREDAADGSSRD